MKVGDMTVYIDGEPAGEVREMSVDLERVFEAGREIAVDFATALQTFEATLVFGIQSRAPWRRLFKPHHAFTGGRHRGTRKWARRYEHRR